MSTNYTPNYNLSQWERTDKVVMDDFNADNAKIDKALAAQATLLTRLEDRKGNCRIWTTSYVGDGQYNKEHPNIITFPWKPELVIVYASAGNLIIMCYGHSGAMHHSVKGGDGIPLTWTERSVQWHANHPATQMSEANTTYQVIAFGMM